MNRIKSTTLSSNLTSKNTPRNVGQFSISEEDLLRLLKITFIKNRKWFKKYLKKEVETDELLTSTEVRNVLKISKTTLFRYIRDGKLVPADLESRSYRFFKSEVNNLLKRKDYAR